MKLNFLIIALITCFGCTNNETKNEEEVTKKIEDLSNTPVQEGYQPTHKIDFSHSIHAELKQTKDCNYCHEKPETKIELNLCASCHDVKLKSMDKLDYYSKLDSISVIIRKFEK